MHYDINTYTNNQAVRKIKMKRTNQNLRKSERVTKMKMNQPTSRETAQLKTRMCKKKQKVHQGAKYETREAPESQTHGECGPYVPV